MPEMLLKRRCGYFCGRKHGFVTDCIAILVLASSLIMIVVYNVSFDEPADAEEKASRTQKHLQEIVRLDKRKQELSVQVDVRFDKERRDEMEKAQARLAEMQRHNAEIAAKMKELEGAKNQPPRADYVIVSKDQPGSELGKQPIQEKSIDKETRKHHHHHHYAPTEDSQESMLSDELEVQEKLQKIAEKAVDKHKSSKVGEQSHVLEESHDAAEVKADNKPIDDEKLQRAVDQMRNTIEHYSMTDLSEENKPKNSDAWELKMLRIAEIKTAKRKAFLDNVRKAAQEKSAASKRGEYILTEDLNLVKKVDAAKLESLQRIALKKHAKKDKSKEKIEEEPPVNCTGLAIGQFMAFGEPRRVLLAGFPKSGALWIHSLIQTITPYYFWLDTTPREEPKEEIIEHQTEVMPEKVRVLISEIEALDDMPDPDGVRESEEELLEAEIVDELSLAAQNINGNITNSSMTGEKVSRLITQLEDEEEAVDEVDDFDSEEVDTIDTKLENAMFTDLVHSQDSETMLKNMSLSETLFTDLANEEKVVEDLDIASDEKIKIEKNLEFDVLGAEPSLDELDEAADNDETAKNITALEELNDLFDDYSEERERIEEMSIEDSDKEDLKHSLQKDVLEKVIEVHETEASDDMVTEVRNKTEVVLNRLEDAHDFVQDMEKLDIGHNHSLIEEHLDYNALEDIVEVIEDIQDPETDIAEDEIELVEEEKVSLENFADDIGDPYERSSIEQDIGPQVVSDALEILDPANDIDPLVNTAENKAKLIDNLMEKESILETSRNLTSDETDAIDVELEGAVAKEIMEAESKHNQIVLQMKHVLEKARESIENDGGESYEKFHHETIEKITTEASFENDEVTDLLEETTTEEFLENDEATDEAIPTDDETTTAENSETTTTENGEITALPNEKTGVATIASIENERSWVVNGKVAEGNGHQHFWDNGEDELEDGVQAEETTTEAFVENDDDNQDDEDNDEILKYQEYEEEIGNDQGDEDSKHDDNQYVHSDNDEDHDDINVDEDQDEIGYLKDQDDNGHAEDQDDNRHVEYQTKTKSLARKKRDTIDEAIESLELEIKSKMRRSAFETDQMEQYPKVMRSVLKTADDLEQLEGLRKDLDDEIETTDVILEEKELDEKGIKRALEVSQDVVKNLPSNPTYVALAEDMIELNSSNRENLEAINKSNLQTKVKLEIAEKLEKEAMVEMAETIDSMMTSNSSSQEDTKEVIKGNLATFLEDTDVEGIEIVESPSLEADLKLEFEENLHKKAKARILDGLDRMKLALGSSGESVQDGTKHEVSELYDELTEVKYEIEAANISAVKKAALESLLDYSFANDVIEAVEEDEQVHISSSRMALEQLNQEIFRFFNEKRKLDGDEDALFMFAETQKLKEKLVNSTIHYLYLAEQLDNPENNYTDNEMLAIEQVIHEEISREVLKETEKIESAYVQVRQMTNDEKYLELLKSDILTDYMEKVKTLIRRVTKKEAIEERRKNGPLSSEEDLASSIALKVKVKPEPRTAPIKVDFTRKYRKDFETSPDTVLLAMRNPFNNLIAMQLKQANLAANDFKSKIFETTKWHEFATSGIKAWYAHVRGWICGQTSGLNIIHYEDFSSKFDEEMGHLMRAIGLPEQYGNTLHCMLSPAIKPRKGSELSYAMKPDFPFNLSLTALIESYMCKVHKTLKDLTGNGLPLDAYLQDLKKLFRDRSRNLPPKFCARPTHQGLNCET